MTKGKRNQQQSYEHLRNNAVADAVPSSLALGISNPQLARRTCCTTVSLTWLRVWLAVWLVWQQAWPLASSVTRVSGKQAGRAVCVGGIRSICGKAEGGLVAAGGVFVGLCIQSGSQPYLEPSQLHVGVSGVVAPGGGTGDGRAVHQPHALAILRLLALLIMCPLLLPPCYPLILYPANCLLLKSASFQLSPSWLVPPLPPCPPFQCHRLAASTFLFSACHLCSPLPFPGCLSLHSYQTHAQLAPRSCYPAPHRLPPAHIPTISSRANAQQPKLFVGMILILIFAEALALYGLIVGIILASKAGQSGTAPPAGA